MVDGEGQADVLLQSQCVQQIEVLEDEAQLLPPEAGQFGGGQIGDILSVQQDMPRADGIDGGDAVQQRGLAAAGGAHDGDEFPLLYFEADAVEGFGDVVFAAVIFFDGFYL